LEKAGLPEAEMNVVAKGATVKQLVRWIEFSNADAAITWHADAFHSDKVRIIPIAKEFIRPEPIPACEMSQAPHPDPAAEYLAFLLSHGPEVFKKHGFSNAE
jgi:molybdate transport system substrate-binding protein